MVYTINVRQTCLFVLSKMQRKKQFDSSHTSYTLSPCRLAITATRLPRSGAPVRRPGARTTLAAHGDSSAPAARRRVGQSPLPEPTDRHRSRVSPDGVGRGHPEAALLHRLYLSVTAFSESCAFSQRALVPFQLSWLSEGLPRSPAYAGSGVAQAFCRWPEVCSFPGPRASFSVGGALQQKTSFG